MQARNGQMARPVRVDRWPIGWWRLRAAQVLQGCISPVCGKSSSNEQSGASLINLLQISCTKTHMTNRYLKSVTSRTTYELSENFRSNFGFEFQHFTWNKFQATTIIYTGLSWTANSTWSRRTYQLQWRVDILNHELAGTCFHDRGEPFFHLLYEFNAFLFPAHKISQLLYVVARYVLCSYRIQGGILVALSQTSNIEKYRVIRYNKKIIRGGICIMNSLRYNQ